MKLKGAMVKITRKAQRSMTLEYLAEGSCECENVYMGSRKDGTNALRGEIYWVLTDTQTTAEPGNPLNRIKPKVWRACTCVSILVHACPFLLS